MSEGSSAANGDALFGHTGFVGGTLARSMRFDALLNSRTSALAAGGSFDLVVCCGVSATKWKANKDPEGDLEGISTLWKTLSSISAKRFVLISTVDVHPDPSSGDETSDVDSPPNHAYGRNRRLLERLVADRFTDHRILRLPALFGEGLKKNALFDLLTGNMVSSIDPEGVFQWYGLDRLASDVRRSLELPSGIYELVSEPLRMGAVAERLFPGAVPSGSGAPRYGLRSVHAEAFGGRNGWLRSVSESMSDLEAFVAAARLRGAP